METSADKNQDLLEELACLQKKIAEFERVQTRAKSIESELEIEKEKLTERIKELNCLYQISKLTAQKRHSFEKTMREIIRVIPSALRYPSSTCVKISIEDTSYSTPAYKKTNWIITQEVHAFKKQRGKIEVCYKEGTSGSESVTFLREERRLLRSAAELLGVMLEQQHSERMMRELALNLQVQKKNLEIKNIALKEVLALIELEKKELGENIQATIEKTVLPLLKRLHLVDWASSMRHKYIEMIENDLENLASSFTRHITDKTLNLSPREVEVCSMIKNGFTNKVMSEALHISILTVERHRHNIRKKLGIANKKVNLTTYLRDMQ